MAPGVPPVGGAVDCSPHGWSEIPKHVDYLSLRPSARVLEAGYVNPALKK